MQKNNFTNWEHIDITFIPDISNTFLDDCLKDNTLDFNIGGAPVGKYRLITRKIMGAFLPLGALQAT